MKDILSQDQTRFHIWKVYYRHPDILICYRYPSILMCLPYLWLLWLGTHKVFTFPELTAWLPFLQTRMCNSICRYLNWLFQDIFVSVANICYSFYDNTLILYLYIIMFNPLRSFRKESLLVVFGLSFCKIQIL